MRCRDVCDSGVTSKISSGVQPATQLSRLMNWRMAHSLLSAPHVHTAVTVNELENGSLAVECPACPHPGRNLPVGWDRSGTQA